jgi:hypothetical protein
MPYLCIYKGLQDDNKIGIWTTHSWQGVYIGHSFCHSNSTPLIYNQPVHIAHHAQYQVVLDEFYFVLMVLSWSMREMLGNLCRSCSVVHHSPSTSAHQHLEP